MWKIYFGLRDLRILAEKDYSIEIKHLKAIEKLSLSGNIVNLQTIACYKHLQLKSE